MTNERISRRSVVGGALALGAATAGLGAPAASGHRAQRRKVVLITGTSSGFGRLTAVHLARAGHEVFASMRDTRGANAPAALDLRTTARRESLALHVVDIDIRDEESVDRGVRRVRDRAGHIDVLVNNAGIFYPAILETLTVRDLNSIFETNVYGHLRMNRAVLPLMRKAGDGLVVQITTALGRLVLPFMGGYVASKWAMEALTEISRYELARLGVDVVIVEPGAYNTDLVIPNGVRYYRDYLRRLSRDDERRRTEYGELAERVETHLTEEPGAPDPQQVADTIAQVIGTPRGQRPLRVWGPGNLPEWEALNTTAARIQNDLLTFAGFGDLA
jgi:NAD(P)-dependent dehydrogenase (short-subunit alcohol dehydrogenase family)